MAISVQELRRWLDTLGLGSDVQVGIDDGGLSLRVVGVEGVCCEVGGLPYAEDAAGVVKLPCGCIIDPNVNWDTKDIETLAILSRWVLSAWCPRVLEEREDGSSGSDAWLFRHLGHVPENYYPPGGPRT